jgi:tetratricopeptide (TPR) repeat protein
MLLPLLLAPASLAASDEGSSVPGRSEEAVQVRVSGEGNGRRLTLRGIGTASEALREIAGACSLRLEPPEEAISALLEGRLLCESNGLSLEDACDVVAGTCGLRVQFPSPDVVRVVPLADSLSLSPDKGIEPILEEIGSRIERLAETDGDCAARADAALALGRAWFAAGVTTRAAGQFAAIDSPAVNADPLTRRFAKLGLAWCDVTVGRTAAGYAVVERLVGENDADPAAVEASILLAREALSRGDGRLAVERLGVAIRNRKPTVDVLETLRAAIAQCGDAASRRAAFQSLRRAIDERPESTADAPLHLELSTLAQSIGNSAAAVAEAARASKLQPDGLEGAEALRRLGRSLVGIDPARGFLCLESARQLVPPVERAKAALDLARLCRSMGLVDIAVERYEEAGAPSDETSPMDDVDATLELADLLLDEGQANRAADLFRRAASSPGVEERAAVGIVRARLAQKDVVGALDVARSVAGRLRSPEGRAVLGVLAGALSRAGMDGEALELLTVESKKDERSGADRGESGR